MAQQHTNRMTAHLILIPHDKNNQESNMAETITNANSTTLVAFFRNHSDALEAISELKDAGFTSSEIGLATAGGSSSQEGIGSSKMGSDVESAGIQADSHSQGKDRGTWEKIKGFFTGQEESYRGDNDAYNGAFEHLSVTGDRARYYGAGIQAGGALVTVRAEPGRQEQAREILMDNDGDLRTSGFEAESMRQIGRRIPPPGPTTPTAACNSAVKCCAP